MDISRMSLKSYVAQEGVTAISNVKSNTNGYPYVTIVTDVGADNLYFSKKASSKVSAGDLIKSFAKDLFVVACQNAQGEDRLKLSFNSEDYSGVDDLF